MFGPYPFPGTPSEISKTNPLGFFPRFQPPGHLSLKFRQLWRMGFTGESVSNSLRAKKFTRCCFQRSRMKNCTSAKTSKPLSLSLGGGIQWLLLLPNLVHSRDGSFASIRKHHNKPTEIVVDSQDGFLSDVLDKMQVRARHPDHTKQRGRIQINHVVTQACFH